MAILFCPKASNVWKLTRYSNLDENMMKRSPRSAKKFVKGTQKISKFFTKIPNDCEDVTNKTYLVIKADDSDEDIVSPTPNLIPAKPLQVIISEMASSKRKHSLSPDVSSSAFNDVVKPQLKKRVLKNVDEIEVLDTASLSKRDSVTILSPSKNNDDLKLLPSYASPAKSRDDETTKKSPSKDRKSSPTKLFNKSPKSLQEFNVEVLENFVKITPSESDANRSPKRECRNYRMFEDDDASSSENKENSNPDIELQRRANSDPLNSMLNDSWDGELDEEEYTLDLTESQHCKVVSIQRASTEKRVILRSTTDNTSAVCVIEGFWLDMRMEVNDTLHVMAVFDNLRGLWQVSNNCGLIVFKPDHLVSTTSVVGALFCKRRSVLSEKYRGFDPSNRIMVVGVLVHKLLQTALRNDLFKHDEIKDVAQKLMTEKDMVWMCYESSLKSEEIEKELMEFVPRIISFMDRYVKKNRSVNRNVNKEDWNGKIDGIQDIEENIWCPELGVKGKVDVSIRSGLTTLPLELKTGRATVSLEHRGQVMLYVMMMHKFGYTVPSGLLLYLREGVLREIPVAAKEKRDLILLRNDLVYFLTRKPRFNSNEAALLHAELPEPISHRRACSSCPYNVICCAHLNYENANLTSNPLKTIRQEILGHLTPQHVDYFVKWSALLSLESSENVGNKQLHEIYTVPPKKREKDGQCIVDVVVRDVSSECDGLFEHTFEKIHHDSTVVNLHTSGIEIGNYVVISTNGRPAVAAGFAKSMDFHTITVTLDRNLNDHYANKLFNLDTYNSNISFGFSMGNLALLLEASEQAQKLREIVIDKKRPTFNCKLPKAVATRGVSVLRRLNKMQQKAVLKALAVDDYLLIKGMPGTGKTATIVALIQIFVVLNKTILVTSHTHAAVDNVCKRLKVLEIDVLRLGAASKVHPDLQSSSEHALTKDCTTSQQLDEVYNRAKVIAVTCLGSGHPLLGKRQFDVCIADESTQVLQSSIFRALYASKKFILIGDPNQLPPVVKSQEAVGRGLSESLFERLDGAGATTTLTYNYRMNKPITAMANALTYKGQLLIANDQVANATLRLPNLKKLVQTYRDSPWIAKVLDQSLSSSVRILDTGFVGNRLSHYCIDEEDPFKCTNPLEAAVVIKLVNVLLEGGVSGDGIGVIAPYRAQASKLLTALASTGVEVSTVDQFQGKDKEVVLYSCTKSCDTKTSRSATRFEILEDKRRLTVAVTRAKHKFILIGDLGSIGKYSPFAKLLSCIEKDNCIKLQDDSHGFNWDVIMASSLL